MALVHEIAPKPQVELDHEVLKRAFFRILDLWAVSDSDARTLLGKPSRATLYNYKRGAGGKLSHDALERVSYVLGIYKALQLLFPNSSQSDEWIKKPNRAFGGQSALERMRGGSVTDLAFVRAYLDSVRG